MRILFIGEVVGGAGVYCVKTLLPGLKREFDIDLTIAAAEGATGGFGLGKGHSVYLHKLGVDVITTGDFAYFKRDMVAHIAQARYLLRPANYPYGNPGRGWLVARPAPGARRKPRRGEPQPDPAGAARAGAEPEAAAAPATAIRPPAPGAGVISLLGQAGFSRVHLRNPFEVAGGLIDRVRQQTPIVLVDFHATTTAEKVAMSLFLDGKVSAVLGTHVRTLAADARLLPGGTAAITHSGRTGSLNSVGGLDPEVETRKFLTQVHEQSRDAWGLLELQGVVLEIASDGRAQSITALRRQTTAPQGAQTTPAAPQQRGRRGGRRR